MNNSYLVELINSLTPKLRSELFLFLESPLFNSGSNAIELISLYKILLKDGESVNDVIDKDLIY